VDAEMLRLRADKRADYIDFRPRCVCAGNDGSTFTTKKRNRARAAATIRDRLRIPVYHGALTNRECRPDVRARARDLREHVRPRACLEGVAAVFRRGA
jgi:hypothetical protein